MDGKPSQILNRLRNLNDQNCSNEVIKSIFLDQIPPQCRIILASSSVDDLQVLAELADKIVEVTNSSDSNISAVSRDIPHGRNLEAEVKRLEARLSEVTEQLRQLKTDRNRERPRTRSQPRNIRGRSKTPNREFECRFHKKYGAAARSCYGSCSWKKNQSSEN